MSNNNLWGPYNHPNSPWNGLQAAAQQQFNQAYANYAQQGMNQQLAAQQYNNLRAQQTAPVHHMWVWNGLPMDVVDFARHAYGDTPEATHFILKYKEIA